MTTLNITDLAARLDTDARTTRKFLRTITPADAQPGKGSRWSIEAKQVQSLKAKFKKFSAEAEAAKVKAIEATPEVKPLTLEREPKSYATGRDALGEITPDTGI